MGGVQEIEVPRARTRRSRDLPGHDRARAPARLRLFARVAPGEPAKIEFDGDIEGVFEMELEDSVTPIAEVTVK